MSMYTVLWENRKFFVNRGRFGFLTEPVLIQTADSVGHCCAAAETCVNINWMD